MTRIDTHYGYFFITNPQGRAQKSAVAAEAYSQIGAKVRRIGHLLNNRQRLRDGLGQMIVKLAVHDHGVSAA